MSINSFGYPSFPSLVSPYRCSFSSCYKLISNRPSLETFGGSNKKVKGDLTRDNAKNTGCQVKSPASDKVPNTLPNQQTYQKQPVCQRTRHRRFKGKQVHFLREFPFNSRPEMAYDHYTSQRRLDQHQRHFHHQEIERCGMGK